MPVNLLFFNDAFDVIWLKKGSQILNALVLFLLFFLSKSDSNKIRLDQFKFAFFTISIISILYIFVLFSMPAQIKNVGPWTVLLGSIHEDGYENFNREKVVKLGWLGMIYFDETYDHDMR